MLTLFKKYVTSNKQFKLSLSLCQSSKNNLNNSID